MSQLFIPFCSRLMHTHAVFSSSPKIFLRTGINTSSPRQKVFNSAYPFSITIPCRLFSQPVLNLYPFLSHSPNTYFSPTNHFLIIFTPISLKKIDYPFVVIYINSRQNFFTHITLISRQKYHKSQHPVDI